MNNTSAFFVEKPRNSQISLNYALITSAQYCTLRFDWFIIYCLSFCDWLEWLLWFWFHNTHFENCSTFKSIELSLRALDVPNVPYIWTGRMVKSLWHIHHLGLNVYLINTTTTIPCGHVSEGELYINSLVPSISLFLFYLTCLDTMLIKLGL